MEATAPGADSDAAGLLQIRVAAEGPVGLQAVAALAAGAVKGALPGGAALSVQMPRTYLLTVARNQASKPGLSRWSGDPLGCSRSCRLQ